MTFNTKIKLFIWCNQGYGDSIWMIPIIEKLLEKYPDVEITLGVFEHHAYLFEHLNIKIQPFSFPIHYRRNTKFEWWAPEDHTPIHLWFGLYPHLTNHVPYYNNAVKSINEEFKKRKLNLFLQELEDWPDIVFPKYDIPVKLNTVFIENGPCFSGQNSFDIDVNVIAEKYKHLNFVCTQQPNIPMDNIDFDQSRSIIDYQNILRKCVAFVGKAGGVSHICYLRELDKMPKGIFGFRMDYKIWAEDFSYQFFDGTYEAIYNFINSNVNVS